MHTKCKICGNKKENQVFRVKERQINKGDMFRYLYCPKCGTLQLIDEIDPGPFYTEDYYSFHLQPAKKVGVLKKKIVKIITKGMPIPETAMYFFRKIFGFSTMILWSTKVNEDSAILDVGGGNGAYVAELVELGYKNVCCIDKFCIESPYDNINFVQGELADIEGEKKYDLIMFNHSFEHIENGLETLQNVERLLKEDGICLIRIPISENYVWNKYKEYWGNIDAPRHYFLYTPRSLSYLCKKAGLAIRKIRWDSYGGQMQVAENYYNEEHGGVVREITNASILEKIMFWHKTDKINRKKIGDTAAFYYSKEQRCQEINK